MEWTVIDWWTFKEAVPWLILVMVFSLQALAPLGKQDLLESIKGVPRAYRMNRPPLTSSVSPVVNRLSIRKAMAVATSSA